MMKKLSEYYGRVVALASSPWSEAIMLAFVRISLAGIFWRSGRTKVIENTWIMLSDNTKTLFENEYAGVPLPSELAARLALGAEHLFPILLVLGLATRFSALALLVMTMVIQIFVYPEAWWQVHIVWVALALVLIVRGGGQLSLDHWLVARKK
jgi:putative oxidoreductase